MPTDPFATEIDTLVTASRAPFAVTPSDSVALPIVPKRLFIGTGGTVALRGAQAESDVIYRNVGSGVYLNVRPSHVRATGTTASDIIAEA